FKVGLEAALEWLKAQGAITITVNKFTDAADQKDQEKWALQLFTDHLLADWFKPTLAPGKLPSGTPNPDGGKPDGGKPDGGKPTPNPGGTPTPNPGGTPTPNPGGTPTPNPGGTPTPNPGGTPTPNPGGTPTPNPGGTPTPAPPPGLAAQP